MEKGQERGLEPLYYRQGGGEMQRAQCWQGAGSPSPGQIFFLLNIYSFSWLFQVLVAASGM